ncbi:MAG: response regulator [Epsilonproteobacteria bacterium]|nr:MAG: response regulator [Campylobacterota bacterium]
MKVLIVDDNANNRMILKLLLEDYEEENNTADFSIEEAGDGLEAIDKCKNGNFDIVLMDIMMPKMDGIEATKIIRENHSDIMIIAVSAVDDTARQKEILSNGAEDYISKPVNSDIFISRIANYITLIKARNNVKNSVKSNTKKINTISEEIYSRNTNFIVTSEDSLSEFWEFFLLNAESKYDNLSDVVRTIFSVAEIQIRLSVDSNIYIEESDNFQYFTLTNIDKLPPKVMDLILKKNKIDFKYKINDNKISFELGKICSVEVVEPKPEVTLKKKEKVNVVVTPVIEASKDLLVFDYIDEDDLYDLEEYSSKLNSLMLVVGSGDVTEEEIQEIYTYLEKIGSVLATYSEVYKISQALTMLSHEMANYVEEFMKNSEALGPMCKAFASDMASWIEMSFHTGAPSIDFMNDTIAVNCETISGMLKINEQSNEVLEDLDDIFDF